MKKLLPFCFLLFLNLTGIAQIAKGKIVTVKINSPSIKIKNGEIVLARLTIYLPPGYEKSTARYPVIYYLHGFLWSDSLLIAADHFNEVIDKAISERKIRPVIIVMPDESSDYGGSFYTNSSLTGNWSDFTAKDVVNYVDKNFRTINDRQSRGISGHSMGGHGAIKLGMLFPEVFSSIYAFSPAMLDFGGDFSASNKGFKNASEIKSASDLRRSTDFYAKLFIALGRAFSPNKLSPPFYCNLPFTYIGDSITSHREVLDLWKKNLPFYMVDQYAADLRKMKAIKFDWGRNDEFTNIPIACLQFSKKLERLGINHYAEEYIGTHGSKIMTSDGRALNEMFPFFDTNLKFQGH